MARLRASPASQSEFLDQALLLVQLLVAASRVPHYGDGGVEDPNSAAGYSDSSNDFDSIFWRPVSHVS